MCYIGVGYLSDLICMVLWPTFNLNIDVCFFLIFKTNPKVIVASSSLCVGRQQQMEEL